MTDQPEILGDPPEFPALRRVLAAQFAANATLFVSSAGIMVLGLAGARLISRYLGQSLYTWTAIIGVLLSGISAGNYLASSRRSSATRAEANSGPLLPGVNIQFGIGI